MRKISKNVRFTDVGKCFGENTQKEENIDVRKYNK